ncbi:MAG: type II toxin-antitoxin system PrlF family antitoxin [Pseudomonadota bacterium]
MQHSTITAKGQTTIPRAIRERLDVRPGDRILYLEDETGVRIVAAGRRISELKGMLPAPKQPVNLEDMDAAIRRRR